MNSRCRGESSAHRVSERFRTAATRYRERACKYRNKLSQENASSSQKKSEKHRPPSGYGVAASDKNNCFTQGPSVILILIKGFKFN